MSFLDFFINLFKQGNTPMPNTTIALTPLMTADQLHQIMPLCPSDKLDIYVKCLSDAMGEGKIDTKQRMACFVGQIAHESNQLSAWIENLNYGPQSLMKTWPRLFPDITTANQYAHQSEKIANRAYGNRMGNGPESSGDGFKYRGRSPIQITGHDNYLAAGKVLGIDLIANPDLAATPEVGFKIAVWFWNSHNLNVLADKIDVLGITKIINGGTLGLAERQFFTTTAFSVLTRP